MAGSTAKKVQKLSSDDQAFNGAIRVHESVVSSIVRKAVLETEGVVRLAGNSLVDNIAEFVGSKAMLDRAISVEMGVDTVTVGVQVILQYGVYIPDVASQIQEAIREQVQNMTGLAMGSVNVFIMDIEQCSEEDIDS